MDNLMSFINDNYGWFLGIGIVLIFGLIGYIADNKKNNDEIKPKKNKIKKEKPIVLEEQVEEVQPIQYEEPIAELPQEQLNLEEEPSNFLSNVEETNSFSNTEQETDTLNQEEPAEGLTVSIPENTEYAYNNYSELPSEEVTGEELYSSDDFDELNGYTNTEIVENPADVVGDDLTVEASEETPHVIDESAVAKQPDTNVEPIETEPDLDDIWKI